MYQDTLLLCICQKRTTTNKNDATDDHDPVQLMASFNSTQSVYVVQNKMHIFNLIIISSGKHTACTTYQQCPQMHFWQTPTPKKSTWTLPNAYHADTQDFPAILGLGPVAHLVPEGRMRMTKMREKKWRKLRKILEMVRSSDLEWLTACPARGWGPEYQRCSPVACTPCRSQSGTPPSPWTAAGISHRHMVECVPTAMAPRMPSGKRCASSHWPQFQFHLVNPHQSPTVCLDL